MIDPRTGACTGSEIGHLIMTPPNTDGGAGLSIEQRLGWHNVAERARVLGAAHDSAWLTRPDLNYLYIRRAVNEGDRAALLLHDELSRSLAKVFAWVIALLRPRHLTLAGRLALLGDEFLACAVEHTCSLVLPDLVRGTTCALETTENLVAVGAVAKAVQQELGII
jgi:predicted NBD/HSP70 family sugar kinase